jgi:hypothetical protein
MQGQLAGAISAGNSGMPHPWQCWNWKLAARHISG